jgi:Zn-dependent protease with chaperone function
MLRLFLLSIPFCSVVGTAIGFLCRRQTLLQLCLSGLISGVYFMILEWKIGSPEEWSRADPIASAMYLFGPFLTLFFAPMFLTSLATSRWSRKS